MFQDQKKNKKCFETAKSENKPFGMVVLNNGGYLYGRVIRESPLTVVGYKNKVCLIITEK